jgi:hypothetical protein
VRSELVFGMSLEAGGQIGEADFQRFLDLEATPRFPDGFTIIAAEGRWRSPGGPTFRENARVLLVWHAGGPEIGRRLDEIREAYKARFAQSSVVRADAPACVAF